MNPPRLVCPTCHLIYVGRMQIAEHLVAEHAVGRVEALRKATEIAMDITDESITKLLERREKVGTERKEIAMAGAKPCGYCKRTDGTHSERCPRGAGKPKKKIGRPSGSGKAVTDGLTVAARRLALEKVQEELADARGVVTALERLAARLGAGG